MKPGKDIADLLAIMARLRAPENGCPWDLAQDFSSIAPYTIEEAYEVADAIERGDFEDLKDELGDLLLQVVFHAQMADEEGKFAFGDVVEAITAKMIRRHPHVFGDLDASDAAAVKLRWNAIKAEEKAERAARRAADGVAGDAASLLDDVPVALPALTRAVKLQKRAGTVGFDWNDPRAVIAKLREEIEEIEQELAAGRAGPGPPRRRTWRHPLRRRQSGSPPFDRSGEGAAALERQVPRAASRISRRSWRARAAISRTPRSMRWKRFGSRPSSAAEPGQAGGPTFDASMATCSRRAHSRNGASRLPGDPHQQARAAGRRVVDPLQHLGILVEPRRRAELIGLELDRHGRPRAHQLLLDRRKQVGHPLAGHRRYKDSRRLGGGGLCGQRLPLRCFDEVDLVPHLDDGAVVAGMDAELAAARVLTSSACCAVSGEAMSRTCRMMSASSTSSSVARKAATSVVGRSEMKPTVSESTISSPCGSRTLRSVGSSVAKSMSLARMLGAGQPVEERRLAGIRVADQRRDRPRHALALGAMHRAHVAHLVELHPRSCGCASGSAGGPPRSASRRGRRGSRSRRAAAPDASTTAPAGSSGS